MFYCYNHYVVSWQWHCYQFINLVSSKKKKKKKFQTTGKLCSFIEKPGINFSFLKKKKEREREREREGFAEISPKFSQSTREVNQSCPGKIRSWVYFVFPSELKWANSLGVWAWVVCWARPYPPTPQRKLGWFLLWLTTDTATATGYNTIQVYNNTISIVQDWKAMHAALFCQLGTVYFNTHCNLTLRIER